MDSLYPLTKTSELRLKFYPKDFEKVRDFYKDLLGYPVTTSWDTGNSRGVMFDAGSAVIELLLPKNGYLPPQGSSASLQVDDVWTLWEKLKDHPDIVAPISQRDWGDTAFTISDPEGFIISFFSTTKS